MYVCNKSSHCTLYIYNFVNYTSIKEEEKHNRHTKYKEIKIKVNNYKT